MRAAACAGGKRVGAICSPIRARARRFFVGQAAFQDRPDIGPGPLVLGDGLGHGLDRPLRRRAGQIQAVKQLIGVIGNGFREQADVLLVGRPKIPVVGLRPWRDFALRRRGRRARARDRLRLRLRLRLRIRLRLRLRLLLRRNLRQMFAHAIMCLHRLCCYDSCGWRGEFGAVSARAVVFQPVDVGQVLPAGNLIDDQRPHRHQFADPLGDIVWLRWWPGGAGNRRPAPVRCCRKNGRSHPPG